MPGNGAGLESGIVRYSGYLLIAIAIISFLIALPDIFITKLPLYGRPASSFFIFNITATIYLAAAIIIPTAVLVGLALQKQLRISKPQLEISGESLRFRVLLR